MNDMEIEFYYTTRQVNDTVANEIMHDEQCKIYHTKSDYNSTTFKQTDIMYYYKCPKFNCAMKEVVHKESDQFIPEYISVTHIDANINTGKAK